MPAMQGREWPAPSVSLLGEENAAGLTVCRRIWQQVLHFIEWNSSMSERHRPGRRNLLPACRRLAQGFKIGLASKHFQPAHGVERAELADPGGTDAGRQRRPDACTAHSPGLSAYTPTDR